MSLPFRGALLVLLICPESLNLYGQVTFSWQKIPVTFYFFKAREPAINDCNHTFKDRELVFNDRRPSFSATNDFMETNYFKFEPPEVRLPFPGQSEFS